MRERYNAALRLVCLLLAGVIVYQISKLALQRDTVARSRMEPLFTVGERTTNSPIATNSSITKTKTLAIATNMAPSKPAPNPSRRPGMPAPSNLPADVQATIDKIKQSQLLGPEIKPPPMALLGIAGKDVFLRAANGQTGIIRQGEELGGAKLIQVGTNRVVVELDGRQEELMIFDGFGSTTLLENKDHK